MGEPDNISSLDAVRRRKGKSWWRYLLTLVLGLAATIVAWAYFTNVDYGSLADLPLFPGASVPGVLDGAGSGVRLNDNVITLAGSDKSSLERQREVASSLARRHVGSPLSGESLNDLRILQSLLDQKVLRPDQTYELQALGVALGDVMAKRLNLRWVIVDDEYGTSRALQYGQDKNFIFPITMISRRAEKQLPVVVAELYQKIVTTVAELDSMVTSR